MLVYKAQQVVASSSFSEKPYEFTDDKGVARKGVSRFVDLTVLGVSGGVGVVRLKGKTEAEVAAKVSKYTIGKPAEIVILGMEDSARGVLILNA